MNRALVHICGIVQGVGFRPFVHRLVRELDLRGTIKNTSSGVELELEGERALLERFVGLLPERAPKLAVIEGIEVSYTDRLRGFTAFQILGSKTELLRNTLISPDICVCDDCLRELFNPADRRYRYPFLNCTNCGPRFTIIRDVPYDRAKTAMSAFPMCPDCEREYHDIENRRYHAQPDCCPVCGPTLLYLDAEGGQTEGDPIALAQRALREGKIVAVKGLGGIHLACRCDDPAIARTLRLRKRRDEKPFALMCRDTASAERICLVSAEERTVLEGFRRPIVLLRKREPGLWHISENLCVGVMLPYTPLHVLLMEDFDMLVMTSANLSETPMLTDNAEAVRALRGVADGFLLHNREIVTRCDDSLCWVLEGKEYFARRSRGYVPFPVRVGRELRPILACGAEQKASFCLSRGNTVFPSQHIGDLKNLETFEAYTGQIAHFERLFDVRPEALVCDQHPDYLSTEYAVQRAEREGIPLLRVQHHHAHLAACMADNHVTEKTIGLIWDGVGLGTDGTGWGAECLIGDFRGFERFGSIRPIPLIGGDLAAKELDRIAFALLREAGCGTDEIENTPVYGQMLQAGLNCPLSSGMGRLFDGISALLGVKQNSSYEGQGAILLEAAATEDDGDFFPVVLAGSPLRFDWREMIRALVSARDTGVETGRLAARFLNTLLQMALEMCKAAREKSGINTVALSGGSFQNQYLMARLPRLLEENGFRVLRHRQVSTNDEGLSLGQLMIADAILEEQKGKE